MRVEPFRPVHLQLLIAQGVQPSQARQVSHVPASYASVEKPPGPAMTALEGDRIVLCGGIIPTRPNVGTLWAVLSEHAGEHMVWLHRATHRFIGLQEWQRLEATVERGFPQGCRWLRLLGFKYEGTMLKYGLNGETHIRFGRT
jgi:hypothetical protein